MPNQAVQPNDYDYSTAGFDSFLRRTIDTAPATNLDEQASNAPTRQLNFDQSQTTGSFGDKLKIGNIIIDGVRQRISIYDDNNNEAVVIGKIDAT